MDAAFELGTSDVRYKAKGAHLLCHDGLRRGVLDFLDAATITLSQLLYILQVLIAKIKFDFGIHIKIGQGIRKIGMVSHPPSGYRASGRCRTRSVVGHC